MHKRSLKDVEHTFKMLKTELFRHVYWHTEIDQKAINHASRKGRIELREAAKHRILNYVANENNPWEGKQTPKKGNIIFYAQHATASCCRKCMEYWYGIPFDAKLSEEQLDYFVELIMMYVDDRLPDLKDEGIYVPRIRNNASRNGRN